MLKILTDESIIRRSQVHLLKSLRRYAEENIPVNIGHMGATIKARVSWAPRLDIWFISRTLESGRFWNAFGCGRPPEGSATPIGCEINFPLRGIDRRIGGLLAEDQAGQIYLLHRGRIGGGKRGIGQQLFRERYRGAWTWLKDGTSDSPAVVIGRIKSPLLARQVAQFVFKVEQLKRNNPGRPQLSITFGESGFGPERVGSSLGERQTSPEAESVSQLVVADLARHLHSSGCQVGNDSSRGLFILSDEGMVSHVFEVKTETTNRALREGIAGLLWNSPSPLDRPKMFLVLPEAPDRESREKMKLLGIRTLTYKWQDDRAVFDLSLIEPENRQGGKWL
ncbi:MAG: hypothetical protein QMD32_06840 [Smithellaceae bacterium]|nr:hypothetical protein [Smithellaceae bacterium]